MEKMFIQDTTLTNIADAIREKTGITTSIFPENMPAQIRSIQTTASDTTGIPDDVVEEANRVANGMISKMGSNSFTFIALSDMHEPGDGEIVYNSEAITKSIIKGNMNAGQAAKIISDKISLDFFANLGDLAWGSSSTTTTSQLISSQIKARQYTWNVEHDNWSYRTPGNHDSVSITGCVDPNIISSIVGSYRYTDFEDKKVRVICLNTSDSTDGVTDGVGSSSGRISGAQLQWFANSLDLSEKADISDWGIVIISHMPLDWGYIWPAANCLKAYLDGSSFSILWQGVNVSYDFSEKNQATVIAQIHGHTHCLRVDNINYFPDNNLSSPTPTSIKRIALPCACFKRSNSSYGGSNADSNNIDFGEPTEDTCDKVDDNTGRNTAFCLISIDLDKKIIYADCFGSKGETRPAINAGYDRIISYAPEEITTYTITNNLTNASTNNTIGIVAEGDSYFASIAADDGYGLDTITVTMSDPETGSIENITASVVDGDTITIANVTGDVVITVTTIKITPYVVSYDLANVESSNTSAETSSNTSFTTTLTAKEGYSINFVRIFMGGVDVTSDVYENNNINIETVTGDIEIIAGYYTNLVPTSTTVTGEGVFNEVGYRNGVYVSSNNSYGNDEDLSKMQYSTFQTKYQMSCLWI